MNGAEDGDKKNIYINPMFVAVTRHNEMEQDHKKELAKQMRDMRIQLIKEQHPIYSTFNFASYSDLKIAEMYKKLIEEQSGRTPNVGEKV